MELKKVTQKPMEEGRRDTSTAGNDRSNRCLCFTGMSSLRNFWGAGFMAMVIGLLVFKDKTAMRKQL